MKKSSLKNYIAFLEAKNEIAELKADAAANANARDYRMGQHELKDEELLKAKDEIAELKRRLERQWRALHSEVETRARLQEDNDLKYEELLKAKDEIAELRRRLDDNGGLCTLRAKLTGETCKETNDRLREDNERLSRLLRYHRHNHNFERNHDDPQA